MTKKILISTDNNALNEFKKAVQGTCDAANQLIQAYEAFQPWEKVRTIEAFMALVSDPKQAYDVAIIANIGVTAKGLQPDPAQAARLFNLHRDEFLNLVAGLPLTNNDCIPCKQVKVKPGKQAISKRSYEAYAEYLIFNSGTFTLNIEAVEAATERFNFFASSQEQVQRYEMFTGLVQALNQWDAVYPFSGADKLTIKKIFNLHLTKADTGEFMLNAEDVKNKLMRL
jgi:hypothetical protein